MIELDDHLLVQRGRLRQIYEHPTDERWVVKLPLDRSGGCRANRLELRAYRDILKTHGELDCVSRCHGFVATNRGEGLLCDCIRDADGAVSPTIWDLVIYRHTCDIEEMLTTVRRFCTRLIASDIRLFDLDLRHIAMRRGREGDAQPVIIDLTGRYDTGGWLPFSHRIKYLSRKKLERRSAQLLERIVYFREHRREFLG